MGTINETPDQRTDLSTRISRAVETAEAIAKEREEFEKDVSKKINGIREVTLEEVETALLPQTDLDKKTTEAAHQFLQTPARAVLFQKIREIYKRSMEAERNLGKKVKINITADIEKLFNDQHASLEDIFMSFLAIEIFHDGIPAGEELSEIILRILIRSKSPELDKIIIENLGEDFFDNQQNSMIGFYLLSDVIQDPDFLKKQYYILLEQAKVRKTKGEKTEEHTLLNLAARILNEQKNQLPPEDITSLSKTIEEFEVL